MTPIISAKKVLKRYDSGFEALKGVDLSINSGEIFALLGPNGAGKTTLISTICGLVNKTSGSILVGGFDVEKDYRKTRRLIGLVPQELTIEMFETVWNVVNFSRGLFGLKPNPEYLESLLKSLTLWDKKDEKLMALSGGMRRRVLIAKALAHEPKVLFLDEPTAGVDVELRKDLWVLVGSLRDKGVTIILTTHYIEEAEAMADRVGVISKGQLILVEEKEALMKKMGSKCLTLDLIDAPSTLPDSLASYDLNLEGDKLVYHYDARNSNHSVMTFFSDLSQAGIGFSDLSSQQSSLEQIFVELVKDT